MLLKMSCRRIYNNLKFPKNSNFPRTKPVRQVCEKYLVNGEDVFLVFMDLEKGYDTIDLHGMWQMLRVYEVGE